ncbi:MAG TPA: GNAT family N-acetyltransferase [Chthoniobacteraceae bacterium]|jgi:GNAT superfamily N-acetyltransferase|nr:GNAT family N-acetyltransferase [Chthoniobacteraceae bacterium]
MEIEENHFARAVPQLPAADVLETAAFYRDVFGFKIDWTWGGNDYGSVSRGDTVFFLSAGKPPFQPITCIVNVTAVDSLYEDWRARGARMLTEPRDMPWGLREFTVADNNGHRLRISQPSTLSPHQPRDRAEGIAYVRRLPSLDEYRRLAAAVGWSGFTNLEAVAKSLPQSLFSIVAEKDGELIGATRVGGDGAIFFYIMDVAVMPEMQGRGIGTALMNAAVAYISANAPEGALTYLFTGARRSTFYQRFGFEGPETWLYGMSAKRLKTAG